ncbi:MAG: DUF4926 domain-containing protein [Armatimonadetes bacterium]|nr:DUF4926 domain-containing protein [Armatimonadota bacterium]
MMREHDEAKLTVDLPHRGLCAGYIGVVVCVHRGGQAYEVEFMTLRGETIAVATLTREQVREVNEQDMPHARVW